MAQVVINLNSIHYCRVSANARGDLVLKRLSFLFGAGPGQPRLRCSPGVVTVFVGPNNAGKSRALTEIAEAVGVRLPKRDSSGKKLKQFSFLEPEPSPAQVILRNLQVALPRDKALRSTFIKAVTQDLAKFPIKSQGEQEPQKDGVQLDSLIGLVMAFAHSHDLEKARKLNPRKVGLPSSDGAPINEELVKTAFQELISHTRSNQLRKLARRWIAKRIIQLNGYIQLLLPHTIVLDGTTRLGLVNNTDSTNWRMQDDNRLANLVKNPEQLELLRDIVYNALGSFPVIDATHPGLTQLKMSKEHPRARERSMEQEALQYFDQALPMGAFSDGVRSFVGLLAAVLSGDHKIILVDEPEAFLHPPLARRVGTELYKLAREQHAQVFAATHSPDFLMGCIQGGTEVSIVRLTYKEGRATARELKPERLKVFMRHPLLRSTGVLGALFHAGAVVCESDADRAFYQEINQRLLAEERGAQDVAFLNAQNKQTIERIIKPLREMGIPAVAILDLDVLSPGDDLSRLLMAAGTEPSIRDSLTGIKDRFFSRCQKIVGGDAKLTKDQLKELTKEQMKLVGLRLLPEQEREEFNSILIRPLAERGIFVVPVGELESWLSSLALRPGRSDKPKWLMTIFERLGDDPDKPEYIKPEAHDVWAFLDGVASWVANPRLGIPIPS